MSVIDGNTDDTPNDEGIETGFALLLGCVPLTKYSMSTTAYNDRLSPTILVYVSHIKNETSQAMAEKKYSLLVCCLTNLADEEHGLSRTIVCTYCSI